MITHKFQFTLGLRPSFAISNNATATGGYAMPEGQTFVPALDRRRLGKQHARIVELMRDARWRTLAAIERETRDPQASISARLRDLRKSQYGSWIVERRRTATPGVFEYRVRSNP